MTRERIIAELFTFWICLRYFPMYRTCNLEEKDGTVVGIGLVQRKVEPTVNNIKWIWRKPGSWIGSVKK